MMYVSTRDPACEVSFEAAILAGLAPDGGLYVPQSLPLFSPHALERLAGLSFAEQAIEIHAQLSGNMVPELTTIIEDGYRQFRHPNIAPLVEIERDQWVMELFHGPTLAFKDHAMQFLVPLMAHLLERENQSAFVLCATSGDTGGAALGALSRVEALRALVLYPDGGVSPFQERQMQSLSSDTCRAIPVSGSFDDCQRLVKGLLARADLTERFNLTAVNSVNWGRIAAQVVYYAHAALKLARPGQPVNFAVPTGNFGNAYAGLIAKRMGFAVGKIIVATNENDALVRAEETGVFAPDTTVSTNSPAMDIQAASNFERLVFDLSATPAEALEFSQTLMRHGRAKLPDGVQDALKAELRFACVSQSATSERMRRLHASTGYITDPHTAIGIEAAGRHPAPGRQTVVLATAHPAKFAETVDAAIGGDNLSKAFSSPSAHPTRKHATIAPNANKVLAMIEAIISA